MVSNSHLLNLSCETILTKHETLRQVHVRIEVAGQARKFRRVPERNHQYMSRWTELYPGRTRTGKLFDWLFSYFFFLESDLPFIC